MDGQPLFPLGKLVITRGVADRGFALDELLNLLHRHVTGDFGEINDEDRQENLFSIEHGFRIMSAYTINDTKLWVFSEKDRSATTILLPEEY